MHYNEKLIIINCKFRINQNRVDFYRVYRASLRLIFQFCGYKGSNLKGPRSTDVPSAPWIMLSPCVDGLVDGGGVAGCIT